MAGTKKKENGELSHFSAVSEEDLHLPIVLSVRKPYRNVIK